MTEYEQSDGYAGWDEMNHHIWAGEGLKIAGYTDGEQLLIQADVAEEAEEFIYFVVSCYYKEEVRTEDAGAVAFQDILCKKGGEDTKSVGFDVKIIGDNGKVLPLKEDAYGVFDSADRRHVLIENQDMFFISDGISGDLVIFPDQYKEESEYIIGYQIGIFLETGRQYEITLGGIQVSAGDSRWEYNKDLLIRQSVNYENNNKKIYGNMSEIRYFMQDLDHENIYAGISAGMAIIFIILFVSLGAARRQVRKQKVKREEVL